MKNFLALLLFLAASVPLSAQVEWLSWEDAISRNESAPRNILVDVYTDWCGWCKKMDKSVFVAPEIAAYISENFYAVKLNAEQREDITYDGHVFRYDPGTGRRGIHALAVALLDGRMSYPSVVYLDKDRRRITISPGFKPAASYLKELRYIAEGRFREYSYEDYLKSLGQ
ncbi:thioredoxin-related protein [Lewinella aquimaris]|uniref:Thioredoxin-related protein n=1 Tax=Neolewinella aquimaris TaxID=1835722 RepID=A0A840DXY3_9BACT|nr:DUF255 domain-containing protein [Neolewinella aquimaris]MBB4077841.1 thioredoxin-related protein [Neolewinella aquimaris]